MRGREGRALRWGSLRTMEAWTVDRRSNGRIRWPVCVPPAQVLVVPLRDVDEEDIMPHFETVNSFVQGARGWPHPVRRHKRASVKMWRRACKCENVAQGAHATD
eukprot:360184-Chlamydomonas_euryale.AAC.8